MHSTRDNSQEISFYTSLKENKKSQEKYGIIHKFTDILFFLRRDVFFSLDLLCVFLGCFLQINIISEFHVPLFYSWQCFSCISIFYMG